MAAEHPDWIQNIHGTNDHIVSRTSRATASFIVYIGSSQLASSTSHLVSPAQCNRLRSWFFGRHISSVGIFYTFYVSYLFVSAHYF
ncbi:hypothetical protein GDO78_001345 [Eleutherodactylus coqui]|uniref:Uncharacterized protein n=1 Tax=Eleutherodactylus coqui TaxID=57060 RepID=A0A8J6FTT4_ELECQ|nr:hypothetical protein GDO78_001345 [Eleutherodactylus coqui]